MDRAQKEAVVEELGQIFTDSGVVVVSHYVGLTVAEMQDYRARMRNVGGSVRVTKNKLAKIALEGTPCEGVKDLLTGMTVFAYSEDPVAAAKATQDFAKDNEKLIIVSGAVDGKILDESGVKTLASTPSLDESRAKLVGLLQAPASALVGLLQAPGGQVARVISARGEQAE